MKKFFDKPWFYRIIALILAILLAVYVASNQQGYVTQGRREETLKTATKTQVIKAPLQVSVNTDKYYVTGYPEKVNLTLEGSNALVISTIILYLHRKRTRFSLLNTYAYFTWANIIS